MNYAEIKGYEGRYSVNRLGQVKGRGGKTISQSNRYRDVRTVRFYINKKRKIMLVHRVVAMAFLPNPKNKPEVNHKDGNPANNRLSNLEWVTKSENALHSYHVLGKKQSDINLVKARKKRHLKDNNLLEEKK